MAKQTSFQINTIHNTSPNSLNIDDQFKCTLRDYEGYEESFDIRSMFLLIKTLLKDTGYSDDLIYTGYDDLKIILNRESTINNILKDE